MKIPKVDGIEVDGGYLSECLRVCVKFTKANCTGTDKAKGKLNQFSCLSCRVIMNVKIDEPCMLPCSRERYLMKQV